MSTKWGGVDIQRAEDFTLYKNIVMGLFFFYYLFVIFCNNNLSKSKHLNSYTFIYNIQCKSSKFKFLLNCFKQQKISCYGKKNWVIPAILRSDVFVSMVTLRTVDVRKCLYFTQQLRKETPASALCYDPS